MTASTFLSIFDDIADVTSSDAFQTGADFLKSAAGLKSVVQAGKLAQTSLEVSLNGIASAESAALSAFQFNSRVAKQNLVNNLQALRESRDATLSTQRAEAVARGIGGSATALAFMNETLNRAERSALDMRIADENRATAARMELDVTMSRLQMERNQAKLKAQAARLENQPSKMEGFGKLASAFGSAAKVVGGLFD